MQVQRLPVPLTECCLLEERDVMDDECGIYIVVKNQNGGDIYKQRYDEYLANPNPNILSYRYGNELFDILFSLGKIRLNPDNNKEFVGTWLVKTHPSVLAMQLTGKVAEAVIVKRCNQDPEINKKWLGVARRKPIRIDSAAKFKAIGTGFQSTRVSYLPKYSPSDPQRDIVWLNEKTKRLASMFIRLPENDGLASDNDALKEGGSDEDESLYAGLQIKASTDGITYILTDFQRGKYEVPVVYFGINNDFELLADNLLHSMGERIIIGEDLVNAAAIDRGAYDQVCSYYYLIYALVTQRIRPGDLLARRDNLLQNAMLSSALESTNSQHIILPDGM